MTQEAATTKPHLLQCRVSLVFDKLAFSIPLLLWVSLMNYDHKYCCLLMRCGLYVFGHPGVINTHPPHATYSNNPLKLHDNDMCSVCSAAKELVLAQPRTSEST